MTTNPTRPRHAGFTLIELIVVVAIIALLVAILVPAVGVVKNQAKRAAVKAEFNSLRLGLEAFRGESKLGGDFPPSHTDNTEDHQLLSNPLRDAGAVDTRVAGAHLLVQAMLGADLLGAPGFKDFGTGSTGRDNRWFNDTHRGAGGAYELGTAPQEGEPLRARYGSGGYVGDDMRKQVKTLADLDADATIQNWPDAGSIEPATRFQPLFVDRWNLPILYYRANPSARTMIGNGSDVIGVFAQEDNGIITGSTMGSPYQSQGIDFGPGTNVRGRFHEIMVAEPVPPVIPTFGGGGENDILTDPDFEDSFVRFILDVSVTSRNTPVRKDSYLLISAGPDARYGTEDDITNWERNQ